MTPEREQLLDQNYSLTTEPSVVDLLKEAREYVHIEAARENYHALVTLLKIDKRLKCA